MKIGNTTTKALGNLIGSWAKTPGAKRVGQHALTGALGGAATGAVGGALKKDEQGRRGGLGGAVKGALGGAAVGGTAGALAPATWGKTAFARGFIKMAAGLYGGALTRGINRAAGGMASKAERSHFAKNIIGARKTARTGVSGVSAASGAGDIKAGLASGSVSATVPKRGNPLSVTSSHDTQFNQRTETKKPGGRVFGEYGASLK